MQELEQVLQIYKHRPNPFLFRLKLWCYFHGN